MEGQGKRVRLYGLSTCPICKRARRFLDAYNIKYENIDVDLLDSGEQWVAIKELKRYNPQATYPTIVIEEVIVGFDEEGLKSVLEIE